MVQTKLPCLILFGLLAISPLAVFGQTSNPPNKVSFGVSMRLTDHALEAISVGYQEDELLDEDDQSSSKKNEDSKSESERENEEGENSSSDNQERDSADSELEPKTESDEKEKSLADSFPVANLRGGINDNSLQRAIAKREIADPNMEFLASAAFAPTEYHCYGPQVWKTWESPNVRYRPLYFEDENLERYGHSAGHHLQPYKSGVHFISRVVTLPYQVAARGTRDCEYGLGYFRPGNCNPAYRQQFELSKRGVVAQALTVGLILGL